MLKDGVLGASSPDARRRALSNAYPLVSDMFPVEHLSGILRWKVLSVVGVGIIAGIGGLWCVLDHCGAALRRVMCIERCVILCSCAWRVGWVWRYF